MDIISYQHGLFLNKDFAKITIIEDLKFDENKPIIRSWFRSVIQAHSINHFIITKLHPDEVTKDESLKKQGWFTRMQHYLFHSKEASKVIKKMTRNNEKASGEKNVVIETNTKTLNKRNHSNLFSHKKNISKIQGTRKLKNTTKKRTVK